MPPEQGAGKGSEVPPHHGGGVLGRGWEQGTVHRWWSPALGPRDHGVEELTHLSEPIDPRSPPGEELGQLRVEHPELVVVVVHLGVEEPTTHRGEASLAADVAEAPDGSIALVDAEGWAGAGGGWVVLHRASSGGAVQRAAWTTDGGSMPTNLILPGRCDTTPPVTATIRRRFVAVTAGDQVRPRVAIATTSVSAPMRSTVDDTTGIP